MNSTETLKAGLTSEEQIFRTMLSSYSIIDIGTIISSSGNRATVGTNIFMRGKRVIYENVELIYPGNNFGTFSADCAKCPCLIFVPRTCEPDVGTQIAKQNAPSYSKDSIKAMPIGNGTNNTVYTRYNNEGNFVIFTDEYTLIFQQDSISLQKNDASASITMDVYGGLSFIKQGANSTHRINMDDGLSSSVWISKNKDVQWTDSLNSDGSRSFVQTNPQNDKVLFSFTVAADGTVAFNMAQGITLKTDGALTLKGASVNIESTDGNTAVTTTNGVFNVNGGNLEVS